MFTGSIPQAARWLVAEWLRELPAGDLYVGCTGAATIERLAAELRPDLNLHGNDVSAFSCCLGAVLAGDPFPIEVAPEHEDEWGWLAPYLTEPLDALATLLLCTEMLDRLGRTEPYFRRQRRGYKAQWDRLHPETRRKLEGVLGSTRLASFTPGDVLEFARSAPADAAFISFPPTYKGGYERLYRGIDEVFRWNEPSYGVFDADAFDELSQIAQDRSAWFLGVDHRVPELESWHRGVAQTSLRSRAFYVYAASGAGRVVRPNAQLLPLPWPHLRPEDEITESSELKLVRISEPQFNALRAEYLDPGIVPAAAAERLAVLIDGKLAGALALTRSSGYSPEEPEVYLLSDFPVRPTRYPRLSKLICALALSSEVHQIAERLSAGRVSVVSTTAFTERASSGKYRGLFRSAGRGTNKETGKKHVNYVARAGSMGSTQEVMRWWLTRHAQTAPASSAA